MSNFLAVAIAVFLDRLFGELPIYHPLRGFSRFATYIEDHWHPQEEINKHTPQASQPQQISESEQIANQASAENKDTSNANQAAEKALKIKGALAVAFTVLPFVLVVSIISQSLATPLNFVFDVFILYLTIGAHNIKEHAFAVQTVLISENLEMARKNLATIVNRDTIHMDRQDIISTCIEFIIENGSEMILAPIFWFLVMGAPGAVLCSLVHALNNMWGYQSPHYKNFGWAVGKANDILNWIPARLAAFSYIVLGDRKNAWQCFNTQAKNWNSPNAELVVATGAGALHLELGADVYYQGQLKVRSHLGQGKLPDLSDIARASDLVERSMVLWLALTFICGLGH